MQSNRIAYVDLQNQLNTIDPNGHNRHWLTHDSATLLQDPAEGAADDLSFQFPTWSPDNRQIASIGGNGRSAGLYTITDDPHQLEQVYFSHSQLPFYIYWSPDSQTISFVATNPAYGIGLHLVSAQGEDYNLLATGQPLFWDWTPEGDQILMHSGTKYSEARLALFDVKRGNVVREDIAQPGLFQTPGIAPNGRYWAYAEADAYDNGQLVVADITTQEQIEVPHEGAVAFNWNPSGDKLAFIAPPTASQRYYGPLQLLDTVGKSVRVLVDQTVLAFFWSPTGRHIAYFTLTDDLTSRPRRTGRSFNGSGNGSYKTNGFKSDSVVDSPYTPADTLLLDLWLVNIADGIKQKITTLKPSKLFVNQFLPFFDQFSLSHRLWSPDGTALVLPAYVEDSTRILMVPIDGAQPAAIGEGKIAFWSW